MLLWGIAVFVAYLVKGICGFANTLIITAMLSFSENNISISPVELLLGVPANVLIVWKNRRFLSLRIWGPPCLLVLLGCVPGILLLRNTDAAIIRLLFGCATVGIGADMLRQQIRPARGKASRAMLLATGILSGLLCGLYGIGALLSAYISRVSPDSRTFKANICLIFVVEAAFRIILYTALGILTFPVFRQAALLFPVSLAGLGLGMLCGGRLRERTLRIIITLMLILSGIVLAVLSLLQL